MNEILNRTFLGNTTQNWITFSITLIVCLVGISIFKRIVVYHLTKWSEKTSTTIDDFLVSTVEKSAVPLFYIASFYFSLNSLILNAKVARFIHVAFLFALTFFLLGIITAITKQFIFSFIKTHEDSEMKEKQASGLLIVLNIIIWVLGIVFLIDNLGYDVTTLITGLGIGGIAIALAAQTILGDLFSYFIIFFDRPFEIGDFIVVDDKMGTVEYIGIKTTRLKTLSGEQLICSNTNLTNSRVHNFKRMEQRRILFKLGVVYQTKHEQLKLIPELVKEIVQSKPDLQFDRGHFSGFGKFSLDFEFVYFVKSPDFNFHMDRQHEIFLDIFAAFEKEKIEFAYPTQTVLLTSPETEFA